MAGVVLVGAPAKAQQSLKPETGPMTLKPAGAAEATLNQDGGTDNVYARPADLEPKAEPFNTDLPAASSVDRTKEAPLVEAPVEEVPATASIIPLSVEVDSLDALTGDSAGILKDFNGGLGVNMWQGMDRTLVEYLLTKLPVRTKSAALRDLMRRLLLTAAYAPKGPGKAGVLISTRAQLLSAMGDLEGVKALMEATPGQENNKDLLRIDADVRLLSGDNAGACQLAASELDKADSPYWSKTMVFCQIMGGQQDAAILGLDLLREVGEEDDAFYTLAGTLLGHSKKDLERLPNPSSLHLAMVQAVKVPLPDDVLKTAGPGLLRAIAHSATATEEMRLEAAEMAEAAGAMDIAALRKIYQSVDFDKVVLQNPLSEAEKFSGPRARALLYQTTKNHKAAAVKAEAIARALDMGFEAGRYAQVARVFQPLMVKVPAENDYAWLAPSAARALLVAGDQEGAKAWIDLLKAKFRVADNATREERALMVLAALSGLDEGFGSDNILPNWVEANKGEQNARAETTLVYTLFDGLGYRMPDAIWAALLTGPLKENANVPHAALWHRYQQAIGKKQVGEVVMLSAIVLGDDGASGADPIILGHILKGLVSIGLEKEARALAVEAAVAAGL